MSRWPQKKLFEIAQVMMGQSPPGETYNARGEGLPFFQGKAEFGDVYPTPGKWCSEPLKIAEPGDILLSVRAPVGPTNIVHVKSCIGRGLAAIRANQGLILPSLLLYFFKAYEQSIAQLGVGSTFNAIGKDDIGNLEIPVPPLSHQEQIVGILNESDHLRRLRAEAVRRTADLVPAFYYEMFGDPATNPKGWPISRAGDLMICCDYGSSERPNDESKGTPIIRMNNVTSDGNLDISDLKYVQTDHLDKYRLQAGDVLFNRTNSRELVGKTGLWDGRFEAVPASYFIRVRFDSQKEHPQHFTTFMNLPLMKRRLFEMARSAIGQANINMKELQSIEIPVPPITLQIAFAALVVEIRAFEAAQTASRRRLDDLFQSLLHCAFHGEL